MTAMAALMLADGRFPAGGHAHSGGLEWAAATGAVHDIATLAGFLAGRLDTAGRVAAGLAAAACDGTHPLDLLDHEAAARTASPALREASRRQGAQLARAAAAIIATTGPPAVGAHHHHAVALGAVARSAGLAPIDAGRLAAYGAVSGPATAAVRLLGLDPFAVHRVVADLGEAMEGIATEAAATAAGPLDDLPAAAAPLLDIGAEHQGRAEVRLFAS